MLDFIADIYSFAKTALEDPLFVYTAYSIAKSIFPQIQEKENKILQRISNWKQTICDWLKNRR